YEIIEEGPASCVSRTQIKDDEDKPCWVVVKTSTTRRKFSKEPHDIIKELRILSRVSHINIIEISNYSSNRHDKTLSIWMPFIPMSLSQLLESPSFSPHRSPLAGNDDQHDPELFEIVAKSILFQILSALTYLHDDERRIAHRDIKPNNIMLDADGCVKLIDFGIARSETDSEDDRSGDLWPEPSDRLYFEVSTGPYRAPELLFGTRSYDATTIDLWSLGATFAEFFTPLKLVLEDEDEYDCMAQEGSDQKNIPRPFILPEHPDGVGATWSRGTLFNGERGEIGLAWSIFKLLGSPSRDNWPDFDDLPGAKHVSFLDAQPAPLPSVLPNLSLGDDPVELLSHNPPTAMAASALDLLNRFLVYPPSLRLKASQALTHPWLLAGHARLVPVGYTEGVTHNSTSHWKGKTLGEWIKILILEAGTSGRSRGDIDTGITE
ncbi:kinase-like domain-containing protein, partial [Infundibulicybe gibba]